MSKSRKRYEYEVEDEYDHDELRERRERRKAKELRREVLGEDEEIRYEPRRSSANYGNLRYR